jgi:hypothetical protein
MSAEPSPVVEGWKAIAEVLGVHVNTAQRYARQNVDPLPVRVSHRGVYARRAALQDWIDRHDMSLQADEELRRLRAEVASLRGGVDEGPVVSGGVSDAIRPVKRARKSDAVVQGS